MIFAFSLLTFLALLFLRFFSGTTDERNILVIVGVYGIILLQIIIDILITWKKAKKLPLLELERSSVLIHIVTLFSFSTFLYFANAILFLFSRDIPLSSLVLIATSFLYFLIYTNIYSEKGVLSSNFSYQYHHHSLYDAAKIYLFFLCAYDVCSIWISNILYQSTALFVIAVVLLLLVIYRYKQVNIRGICYVFLFSLLIAVLLYFIVIQPWVPLIMGAVFASAFFYLAVTFFHYKMEGIIHNKTVMEHALFVFIIILIIFFSVY